MLSECDELQHRQYVPSCDVRHDFDIASSVALGSGHKLRIIHYNPDAYKIGAMTQHSNTQERLQTLFAEICQKDFLFAGSSFERVFLCYDRKSSDSTLPVIAEMWNPIAHQISHIVQ